VIFSSKFVQVLVINSKPDFQVKSRSILVELHVDSR